MKKLSRIVLTMAILLLWAALLPTQAQAAEFVASGTCGESITWSLDDGGILTISGSGEMTNYDYSNSPWNSNEAIKQIVIEEGVTTVGAWAFYGCTELESVSVAGTVVSIGSHAFAGSGITELSLPESVQSIGEYAFYDCGSLVSASLPERMTIIDKGAFQNCRMLEIIHLPEGITEISPSCFRGCGSLTEILLPNSVVKLSENAFEHSGLTSITIPAGVVELGHLALHCENLGQIFVEEGNSAFSSDESGALFNSDKTVLIKVPAMISGAYTVPEGVKVIGQCAFMGCKMLTQITLPEGLERIEEEAFYYCYRLSQMTIPASVTQVSSSAFAYCTNLTGIWVDEESTAYSSDAWGVLFNKDKTVLVKAPKKLSGNYIIPNGVKTIGDYAFEYCDITGVVIPEGVTSIGNYAFSVCYGITEVIFPGSLESLGAYAFNNCNGLTEVTVPGNVKTIGERAFFACGGLTTVTIEEGVEHIGGLAFGLCNSLTTVTFPESLKFVGEKVFYESYSIQYTIYGEGLYLGTENNPYAALLGASSDEVTSITVHEDTVVMVESVFSEHPNLTDISLSKKITRIPGHAFYQCNKLQSIVIPEGITEIGYWAFFGCDSLKNVTIPASVTQMDNMAFFACQNLENVYIFDASAWCKIQSEAGRILNQNSLQLPILHLLDAEGNELTHIILDDTVTEIPGWAFATTTATHITIPRSVTAIGEYAFWNAAIIYVDYKGTLAQWYAMEVGICNDAVLRNTLTVECVGSPEHAWDEGVVTKDATCVMDGSMLYTCTVCEFQKTEVIPMTNVHILNEGYISIPANCKDEGEMVFDCMHCSYRVTETIEKTNDHLFEDWLLVDENTHKQVCGICGKEETASHSWGEGWVTLEPTCKDEGIRKFLCSVCGGEKTEAIPKLTVHEWNDWSKLDDSTHQRDCRVCGQKETGEHSWDSGRITKEPTCGEEGEMTYQCTVCYCTKTEPVEKTTDHQWDDGFMTQGATCITEGLMTYTCYVCGSTRTEAIPVLSEHYWNGWVKADEVSHKNVCLTCGKTETATHSWDAGQVSVQPTCATQGEKIYSCTVCYCTKTEVLDKLTEHTWDDGVMTQGPTCLTEGVTTYTCTVCGNTRTEAIPVLTEHYWNGWEKADDGSHKNVCMTCGKTETASHSWDSSWFERMPTCGVEGEKTYQCSVCSATKFETVPKLTEHTWIGNWEYADGNSHKQTCTVCGKEDAASHNWGNSWISVIPTCAAEGEKSYQCTVCYGTRTEVLEKLTTHSFGSWTAVDDSTHTGSCAVCQKEETLAHSWDGGWIERQPTCAEEGVKTYRCTACDHTKMEMLPKLTTHSWDGGVVTAEPTKEAEGVKTYTCAVCGETMTEAIPKIPTYTVVFKNWDGTVLSSGQYAIGEEVTAPADPTRPTDKDHSYAFAGWDQAVVSCAGNAVYTATYTQGPPVPETITSSTHTVSGNTISNIGTGTTTEKLLENLNEGAYVKVYSGNEEVSKDALLGTGMVVKIMDGDRVVTEVTAVVTGDTNGDGKITITDMLSAKAHLLKKDTLEGVYAQGGDTNGDGNISITDFLQMKAHILGKDKVEAAPIAPAPAAAATSETDAAVTVAYYSVTEAFVPGKKSLLAI